jgi:hypothetical protein
MFHNKRRSIVRGQVNTFRIAVGSKPLWTMQFVQRSSLPGPYAFHSVFSIRSEKEAW